MQKEEAIREWALDYALETLEYGQERPKIEDLLMYAQKVVDFITKDISKPNMP